MKPNGAQCLSVFHFCLQTLWPVTHFDEGTTSTVSLRPGNTRDGKKKSPDWRDCGHVTVCNGSPVCDPHGPCHRFKSRDNCQAFVKCHRLVPLGPRSHSWQSLLEPGGSWPPPTPTPPLALSPSSFAAFILCLGPMDQTELRRRLIVWRPELNQTAFPSVPGRRVAGSNPTADTVYQTLTDFRCDDVK